jgi:FkbM family methyltransferase
MTHTVKTGDATEKQWQATKAVAGIRYLALRLLHFATAIARRTPLTKVTWLNRLQASLAIYLHGRDWVQVGPFRVHFHTQDRVHSKRLILRGGHEQREIELLCALTNVGDCVMDVGSSIGLYALHLSRAVGPSGMVVAVEPNPKNVRLLRRNVEANDCLNVTIVEAALGERNGDVELFLVRDHPSNSSLADLQHTNQSVTVQLRRGRDLLADLGTSPRVVKVDVEGYEPQVYDGLAYTPEVLMLECVPRQLRALGNEPIAFLRKLEEQGYSLRLVDPDSGEARLSTPERIVQITEQETQVHNVLALHRSCGRNGSAAGRQRTVEKPLDQGGTSGT